MAGTEPGTDAGVWKTDERPRRDGDAGRKTRKVQRRTDRGQVIASPSAIEDLWDRRGRPCGRGCWVAGRGGHKKEGASCLKTSRRRNGSIALPPGSAVGIHTRCHGVLLRIPAWSSSCPAPVKNRHAQRRSERSNSGTPYPDVPCRNKHRSADWASRKSAAVRQLPEPLYAAVRSGMSVDGRLHFHCPLAYSGG